MTARVLLALFYLSMSIPAMELSSQKKQPRSLMAIATDTDEVEEDPIELFKTGCSLSSRPLIAVAVKKIVVDDEALAKIKDPEFLKEISAEDARELARYYFLVIHYRLFTVDEKSYGFSIQDYLDHWKESLFEYRAVKGGRLSDNFDLMRLNSLEGLAQVPQLHEVRVLHLGQNELTEIDDTSLDLLVNLEELYLNNNKLQRVPANLRRLTRLKQLCFNTNEITSCTPAMYQGLRQLEDLNMNSNNLTRWPSGSFSGLDGLTELDLVHNKIPGIEVGSCDGLTRLTQLALLDNEITFIQPGANLPLHNLKYLDLQANALKRVSPDMFEGLVKLEWLNLSCNLLRKIQADALGALPSLKILRLNQNPIDEVELRAFVQLTNLEKLNLGSARLAHFPVNAVERLTNLKVLDLRFQGGHAPSQLSKAPFAACLPHLNVDL